MQRRAAGIYVIIFLIISSGSYGIIRTAQQPTINVNNPDKKLTQNKSFNIGGRDYNVKSLGSGSQPTKVTWKQESANYSTTLNNNTTVEMNNTTFRLHTPNTSDPQTATFREVQNLSNSTETINQNNNTYVVINDTGGNVTLIPIEEYKRQQFDDPQQKQIQEQNTLQYNNNTTKVQNITNQSVILTWQAPKSNTVLISNEGTTQLGPNNTTFVTESSDSSVLLSSNVERYRKQAQEVAKFHNRIAGFWGVTILSFLAAMLLAMLAYLPAKN